MSQSFSFRYTFEEMHGATWFSIRKRWLWRGGVRYVLILAFIMMLVMEATSSEHSWLRLFAELATGLIVGCAGLAVLVLYWFWCVPRSVRRSYAQLQLDGDVVSYEFDDRKIQIADETLTLRLPWERLIKWSENDRYLLLYRTDTQCHFVPKRMVEPAMIEAIKVELAKARVRPF